MNDEQLRWVQYNHGETGARARPPVETERTRQREEREAARRGAVTQIGKLVRAMVEKRSGLTALQQKLLAILDEEGGIDLAAQVTGLGLYQGILRIETADPVTLYNLRMRWQRRLLEAVQSRLPEAGIRAVRFSLAGRSSQSDSQE